MNGSQFPHFEPLGEVSQQYLTTKRQRTLLLEITLARCIGAIGALSIDEPYLELLPDNVILKPGSVFIPKFHQEQEITLSTLYQETEDEGTLTLHKLKVWRALRIYLERTNSFRTFNALLVSSGGNAK